MAIDISDSYSEQRRKFRIFVQALNSNSQEQTPLLKEYGMRSEDSPDVWGEAPQSRVFS
jgi:hypothetical protein